MNKLHALIGPMGFDEPARSPGALSAENAAAILAAVGDVSLVLAPDGTILDLSVSSKDLAQHGLNTWRGRAWVDTVTVESRLKVEEMLRGGGDGARWRQVNHPTANGEIAVRWLAMPLGGDGRLIAIGQDLRTQAAAQQRLLQTQQALERDYIRLRQAEARYRMLFDEGSEPVLIVDAGTRRIREANPAAHALLGVAAGSLSNQPASALFEAADRETLIAYFGAAEAADAAPPATLRLVRSRGTARVFARLFRQARAVLLLVRIAPLIEDSGGVRHEARLDELVERMPDAFVMTDANLSILTANAAFLELTEAASADRVDGAPLSRWLGRAGIDLELMMGQLRDHGVVRNVSTILRGDTGGQEEVEVSAVAAPDGDSTCYGFTIRSVGRRLRSVPDPVRDLPRSVEQLTELVGRMSLKDIVRESTDLIERLCIEAALAYTDDNRASAAEILGLSRQSLYSKLHRHGLGSLVSGDDAS
ncbi:transcriptional regulator PpsR [Sphingomonas sp. SUN019]|uniref:transcriptional regulator PpsR n=1 Tax=Sphingomonas sp. SUN019 TaxID=2937788 RepID=UPI0021643A1E|nr:transcriptional regulator PpsR [Sphingomonas sp. SUN019]UVO50819.1 transcriptional regulator PpsR [Sphingomonas sp. SUN019]